MKDKSQKNGDTGKCKFCGKFFSQEGILKMHIHLIHEDLSCDTCGKSFSTAGTLKRHI